MKRILLAAIVTIIFFKYSQSQEIDWAKKIGSPPVSKGLLSDQQGNLYHYGSNNYLGYYGYTADTIGTFFQKYSRSGELLIEKRWKLPFHIQDMIYDGDMHFYFTGNFFGTNNLDGNLISSMGKWDGILGKIDLEGNIHWATSFGGNDNDFGGGICLNKEKDKLILTGCLTDSLFVNHKFQGKSEQPLLIAIFSLSGDLEQHLFFDFLPGTNKGRNAGYEVCSDKSGNFFILFDREGRNWNGTDSTQAPLMGRYIMKLTQNLDSLWSTYIIGPGCYYGYSCRRIKVSDKGDPYVFRYCSEKYGGEGEIVRLNGENGKVIWSFLNSDSGYNDMFLDSNTVFLVGTEGANRCPCPGNHDGYQIIKKISENNELLGETRIGGVGISNIIKTKKGDFFIKGAFRNFRSVKIGTDLILADSTKSNNYYSYNGNFLAKINDINCTPPEINTIKFFNRVYQICEGNSITLTTGSGYSSYLWSNGCSTPTNVISSPGIYTLQVEEESGCTSYSLPVTLQIKKDPVQPEICLATYDTATKKNRIYWKLNWDQGTHHYNIFKETISGIQLIDTINYIDYKLNNYIDLNSNPDSLSCFYSISTVDTCGNESLLSNPHKPIQLKLKTEGNQTYLEWEHYQGIPFDFYAIYRGPTLKNMELIDSVKSEGNTYDIESKQKYFYQVRVNKSYACYIIDGPNLNSTSSNFVANFRTSLSNQNLEKELFIDIFPNPANDRLNFSLKSNEKYVCVLKDVLSKVVKNFTLEKEFNSSIDISDLAQGVYLLGIKNGTKEKNFRILKQ